MKFINYLTSIAGIDIYPMISLFIFVIFFSVVTFWAFSVKKEQITELEQIPLKSDQASINP